MPSIQSGWRTAIRNLGLMGREKTGATLVEEAWRSFDRYRPEEPALDDAVRALEAAGVEINGSSKLYEFGDTLNLDAGVAVEGEEERAPAPAAKEVLFDEDDARNWNEVPPNQLLVAEKNGAVKCAPRELALAKSFGDGPGAQRRARQSFRGVTRNGQTRSAAWVPFPGRDRRARRAMGGGPSVPRSGTARRRRTRTRSAGFRAARH